MTCASAVAYAFQNLFELQLEGIQFLSDLTWFTEVLTVYWEKEIPESKVREACEMTCFTPSASTTQEEIGAFTMQLHQLLVPEQLEAMDTETSALANYPSFHQLAEEERRHCQFSNCKTKCKSFNVLARHLTTKHCVSNDELVTHWIYVEQCWERRGAPELAPKEIDFVDLVVAPNGHVDE